MPKLHDCCQIIAEEALNQLRKIPEEHRGTALALIGHQFEDDLRLRHPDAEIIAHHFWLVVAELIEKREYARAMPDFLNNSPEAEITCRQPYTEDFREDDIGLAMAADSIVRLGRKLFRIPDNRNAI